MSPSNQSAVESMYGYTPSLAAGVIFSIGFGISVIAHMIQTFIITVPKPGQAPSRKVWGFLGFLIITSPKEDPKPTKRIWWMLLFVAGAACELIEWAGRAYNARYPDNSRIFVMQGSVDIIGPIFFMAGFYACFATVLRQLETTKSWSSSWIPPTAFSILNLAAMLVLGLGDAGSNTGAIKGGALMQLVSFSLWTLFFLATVYRNTRLFVTKESRQILALLSSGTLLMLIWAVYQTITALQGWAGFVNTHQGFVIGLDAIPSLILTLMFNIAHPAKLLSRMAIDEDSTSPKGKQVDGDYA